MDRTKLSDSEWVRIVSHLTKLTGVHLGSPDKCRRFIGASLWILRTGAQWRTTLPPEHGKWNSVFKRYSRWCSNGAWDSLLNGFSEDADIQYVSIDGTVTRAHACAAGAVGRSAEKEALGRSKGGFSCKIHAACDVLGLPHTSF